MSTWLIGILGAVIAVLLGIISNKTRKLREKTEELEAERIASTRKAHESEVLREAVDEIEKIHGEKKRDETPPPESGDVGSHLDRLGRMHEH